jgi:hypothetical protein
MNPDNVTLENISKMFEYEKLSRDIDSIDDIEILRNFAKSYIKLYLSQQEVIANLKL